MLELGFGMDRPEQERSCKRDVAAERFVVVIEVEIIIP